MRLFDPRLVLVVVMSALVAACSGAGGKVTADDMTMGDPKAPVTMIEYASVSCVHCARFNNDVFPAFKAKYIDTGKVHYVYREFLTSPIDVAAAGVLLARCSGKDNYFKVVDAVFRGQNEMFADGTSAGARPVLLRIAQSTGMTEAQFSACVGDEKALNALNERVERYSKEEKINGTPTFVINGKTYSQGEMTLAELDAAVAEAQKK